MKRIISISFILILMVSFSLIPVMPAMAVTVLEVGAGKTYATIQEAIVAASSGDIISVFPGTYDQDEANGYDPTTGGAGGNDFNIFVNEEVTIQGVNAAGNPITNYLNILAFVKAKRQLPTFGQSAIFVQADRVTITGLDISGWAGTENNKTVEVIGDDFTLKNCSLHGMDSAAALYISDFRFDAGTDTSHVRSYHIYSNLIDGGGVWPTGIRIASGAGWTGPASDRVISRNTFANNLDAIAFVGPGADPWDVYPVGAATITKNKFNSSVRRHVIAWGKYNGVQGYADLDWKNIVACNTFDKAAVTWTPSGDARSWDSGSFFYIRGIYSAIQRYAVNKAEAGDLVQVLPGIYDEQVVITKNLTLCGAGDATIIKPSSSAVLSQLMTVPWYTGTKEVTGVIMADAASSVIVKKLKIDGQAITAIPTGANWVTGVLYRETGGVIDDIKVINMTIVPLEYAVRGYGIVLYAGGPDAVAVEVKYCYISNYDKNGINAQGNKLTANIHHNTVVGRGPVPENDEVQNGILIIDNATGSVDFNRVSNNGYVPATWGATGIAFINAGGSAKHNILTDNQMGAAAQTLEGFGTGTSWTVSFTGNTANAEGISVPGISGLNAASYVDGVSIMVTMDGNLLTGGAGDGISIGDLEGLGAAGSIVATLTNNFIYHWDNGIHLYGSLAAGSTITGNTIIDNESDGSGIHIDSEVNAANVAVHFNNIDKNKAYGIYNGGTGILNAENNWWGSSKGPSLNSTPGKGDKISGDIDFTPWLKSPYKKYSHPKPWWPKPHPRWPHNSWYKGPWWK
ncbi:MAG: hypothetical protein A2144_01375 [Chloroflexi bacterium RBG_16_50_9]|nr:MAG: hypothetical protein A2144_01375 [Chloroflexi bacterium RBG_16_50_9]